MMIALCVCYIAGEKAETMAEVVPPRQPSESTTEQKSIEVDASHPEVVILVEAAVKVAKEQEITLPPEVWIETMETAIEDVEKEIRNSSAGGPL